MLDQHRGDHDRPDGPPPPLGTGQQAVDQQFQRLLERRACGGLGQLERLAHELAGRSRAQDDVTAAGQLVGVEPHPAKAVGERGRWDGRQLAQRADAQALKRFGQLGQLRLGAQQLHRHRRQECAHVRTVLRAVCAHHAVVAQAPARAPAHDDDRAAYPGLRCRYHRREPRRRHPIACGQAKRPAGGTEHTVYSSVQPHQTASLEAAEPRPLGLDRRSNRLKADEQPLPEIRYSHRVRRYELQPRTPGKRFSQGHSGMDAEGLGRERYLAYLLHASGLGCQSGGHLQQLIAVARSDGELEAGKQNADDHR
jgi:hypothetical protein